MNDKGGFSIIAALLVAIILVASVTATYSAIRYSPIQSQPQILSAVDETNLAIKQILGFTVGYYGSVMQVTGNSSYAQMLATNYLDSGLENVANINPEWGASFNVGNLSLGNNWFTNESYSQAVLNLTYDLTGLGISGIAYSASCRLDVQINPSPTNNQISLTVLKDEDTPLVGLSMTNFKFYLYQYNNLTWATVNPPNDPISSSNGTYLVDVPSGINPQSYSIQVQDSRGITVAASSFSRYTAGLVFNSSTVSGGDYVNQYNSSIDSIPDQGTHSNFTAQQYGPDNIFDTLTEQNITSQIQDYSPDTSSLQLGTTIIAGNTNNLKNDDASLMSLQSYASAYSTTQYNNITKDTSNSSYTNGATSVSWQHTTSTENDRILLVSVDTFSRSGNPTNVNSVYYGAILVTSNVSTMYSTTNPTVRSSVFYLVNPPSGTNTITVNFASSTAAVCGSTTYYNVNQTLPVLASNSTTSSGSTQTISLSASGANSKLLYGHLAAQISSSTYTLAEGTQQNSCWSNTATYNHGGTNYYCAGRSSDKSVTNGTITLSWNSTHSINWAAIALLLQPTQLPTQEICQIILSGPSNTLNLNNLLWSVDGSSSINTTLMLQLFNFASGKYPTSGDGCITDTLGLANRTEQQTITSNIANFRDDIGRWQLILTATASVSSPFTINLDLARYRTVSPVFGLSLEEQWTNLNSTVDLHPTLCIDAANASSDNLAVDIWHAGAWQPINTALVNGWNNMSVNSYLDLGSSILTIRFRSNDTGDNIQSSWKIDSALLRPESDQDLLMSLQNPAATVAVELLQNGTTVWLGQNLQFTTQSIPVPPVPVKAIHINETIDGVNQQVPFQIEDWASFYSVPLGLTSNTTVFGNRQMIVFLVNTHVSDFTLWWNGSDQATQTPLAFNSNYFTGDNPSGHTLTNGRLTISISTDTKFTVTSKVGNITSTATYMRINNQPSTYGASEAYVIHNGVIRDIIQQEAEWSNGASGSPNLYANIVLTLPANATYYTYQLGIIFVNSQQNRTINDLCPVALSSSVGQPQTENGTIYGDPIVATGTQTFSNSTGIWAHHWSQFTDGTNGAGIMFTDQANQMLYTFDTMSLANATGALKADSSIQTISLLPVTLSSVSFQTSLDVTWYGAVATFDASAPQIYNGDGQPGLWILAELPPTITVTTGN